MSDSQTEDIDDVLSIERRNEFNFKVLKKAMKLFDGIRQYIPDEMISQMQSIADERGQQADFNDGKSWFHPDSIKQIHYFFQDIDTLIKNTKFIHSYNTNTYDIQENVLESVLADIEVDYSYLPSKKRLSSDKINDDEKITKKQSIEKKDEQEAVNDDNGFPKQVEIVIDDDKPSKELTRDDIVRPLLVDDTTEVCMSCGS